MSPCVIELLGGLRVRCGEGVVTRFRTQRTAALLAYLAYHLGCQHGREELVDLLWPDADIESGRMRLRSALASLRRQLEPPGTRPGSILAADRTWVSLNRAAVTTDVLGMEAAIAASEGTDDPAERASHLEQAAGLYRGPLLPGLYDEWVVRERERLQLRHQAVLLRLAASLEQAGECRRALEAAHRAVTLDPLAEEAHCALMRLYAATGQPAAVTRQYRELSRLLRRELKTEPSAATRELYARLGAERATQPDTLAVEAGPARPAPRPARVEQRAAEPGPDAALTGRATARLPLYLTPFFGLEQEKARILEMLRGDGVRLVTLTGPGGSGKTRLAVEVARELVDEYAGAVWFVALADVGDAALIPATIVRALDLPPGPGRTPQEMLGDALGYRRSLLVLDNYEQLVEPGALVVNDLLRGIPTLSCLVTSRQRMELSGEHDCPVPPLPIPDMPGTPEWLMQYASVRLFVDRARAARPDFQLTAGNAPAVAALCERLEGIPLALELAAGWSQVLTPGGILTRLCERDDLLASPRRDVEPRHRTLRATFESSYRLLTPGLQRALAWLSVFRGGWTLEAADRVCAGLQPEGEADPGDDTLVQMRALEARSLVLAEEAGDEMRFRMLESLRGYAAEQLSAEDRCTAEEEHAAYYTWLAEQAEKAMDGADQAAWMARLDREVDNVRAVMERALGSGDVPAGLRLATALSRYWQASGGGDEGLRWMESLLAREAVVPPALRARALREHGDLLLRRRQDTSVVQTLEESLRLYTELGDEKCMATVLRRISCAVQQISRDYPTAVPLLERSLALCRSAGDMRGIAETLRFLGSACREQGDCEAAEAYYEQSRSLYRETGDVHGVAAVSAEMGYMLQGLEQYDRAEALMQEALDLSRGLGNKHSIGHGLWLLGRLAQDTGRFDTAAAFLEEGLALARQTANRQQMVNCLVNLGMLAGRLEDPRTARRRYAEALGLVREIGSRSSLFMPLYLDGLSALETGEYGAARERFRECLSIARQRGSRQTAIDCLVILARTYQADAQAETAAQLQGAADSARRACEMPMPPDPAEHARDIEGLRSALGDARFEEAWAVGAELSLEQAIEMALSSL